MRSITVRIAAAVRISWLGAAMVAAAAVAACAPVERGTVEVARVQVDAPESNLSPSPSSSASTPGRPPSAPLSEESWAG